MSLLLYSLSFTQLENREGGIIREITGSRGVCDVGGCTYMGFKALHRSVTGHTVPAQNPTNNTSHVNNKCNINVVIFLKIKDIMQLI